MLCGFCCPWITLYFIDNRISAVLRDNEIRLLALAAGVLAFTTDQPLVLACLAAGSIILLRAAPGNPGRFVVVGQVRPTTGQTLYAADLVGQVVGGAGVVVDGQDGRTQARRAQPRSDGKVLVMGSGQPRAGGVGLGCHHATSGRPAR